MHSASMCDVGRDPESVSVDIFDVSDYRGREEHFEILVQIYDDQSLQQ